MAKLRPWRCNAIPYLMELFTTPFEVGVTVALYQQLSRNTAEEDPASVFDQVLNAKPAPGRR